MLPNGVRQYRNPIWGPPSGSQSVVTPFWNQSGEPPSQSQSGLPILEPIWSSLLFGANMGCLFQVGSQSRVPHLGIILGCSIWEPTGEPIWDTRCPRSAPSKSRDPIWEQIRVTPSRNQSGEHPTGSQSKSPPSWSESGTLHVGASQECPI